MENGLITWVLPGETLEADEVFDASGLFVSPGFIDLHTHGGDGCDYMDGTVEAFVKASAFHMRHGTTALLPTLTTASDEELFRAMDCFRAAKEAGKNGPAMPGLHLEGPYFAAAQAGAQDPRYLQAPEKAHYEKILARSSDIARVSAAVELPGAFALGDALKERGILAAIGHSDAAYADVLESLQHGYTHVTHFYSGMSMLRRNGPYRELGVVESAYLLDELSVEIIADGCHLPPELLRLIVKLKGVERISLITDSMRGAGLPDGTSVKIGSLTNGVDAVIENGVAVLPDRTSFAGSVCTADRCVRTMVRQAGVPLTDAVRMMTANPAAVISAKSKGRLAAGMDADICVFDQNINVCAVFVGGVRRV